VKKNILLLPEKREKSMELETRRTEYKSSWSKRKQNNTLKVANQELRNRDLKNRQQKLMNKKSVR